MMQLALGFIGYWIIGQFILMTLCEMVEEGATTSVLTHFFPVRPIQAVVYFTVTILWPTMAIWMVISHYKIRKHAFIREVIEK